MTGRGIFLTIRLTAPRWVGERRCGYHRSTSTQSAERGTRRSDAGFLADVLREV